MSNNSISTEGGGHKFSNLQVVFLVTGSFGILANTVVIIVIGRTKPMRKKLCNKLIINQSLVDLIASICLAGYQLTPRDSYKGISYMQCAFWMNEYAIWSMMTNSSYCLLAITFERYLGVVHPLWHRSHMSTGKIITMIAFVWLFGPVFQLSYALTTSIVEDGVCHVHVMHSNLTLARFHGIMMLVVEFFLPFTIMLFFYSRMLLVIRRSMKPNRSASHGQADQINPVRSKAKKNVISTLCIVCLCYFLCWIWNQVFFLAVNVGYPIADYSSTFYDVAMILVYMNCCINPVVYCIRYQNFQHALRELLCCFSRYTTSSNPNSTSGEGTLDSQGRTTNTNWDSSQHTTETNHI